MKSIYTILICVLIFCHAGYCQTSKIDSLKSYIEQENDNYKKIEALSSLADQFQNPNDKLIYARQAFRLSETSGDKGKMIASIEVGICYGMLGILDSSKFYFTKSLESSLRANDSIYISRAYNGLGNLDRMQSNLDQSLTEFLTALDYGEALSKQWRADILTNISGVYFDLQDFEESLKKVMEARVIYEELNDQGNLSYTSNLLAIVHRALGNLDLAYMYNEEALKILLKSQDTIQIIYNYLSSTDILMEQGKLNDAINRAIKVSEMAFEFNEIDPLISSKTTLGFIYLKKGEIKKSEKYIDEAIAICSNYDVKSKLPDLYELKSIIVASKRDYEGALNLINKRKLTNDSIRSMEIADRISELNIRYETEKKENEIIRLNAEQKLKDLALEQAKTRNIFLSIVLLLGLIIIGVIWYFYQQRIKINQQLRAANEAKDRLFSIVAHDIKNPLSAFKAITNSLEENYRSMSTDEVGLFISKLDSSASNLFYLLQNLLEWSITQSGNLNFKAETIQLQSVAEEAVSLFEGAIETKSLQVGNKVESDIKVFADHKMLFSVIRNLISNSVKFTPTNGSISIASERKGNMVEVSISDTGVGLTEDQKKRLFEEKTANESKSGTGLGLVICREFIEKNGGSIWVESELGKGSQFKFTLQLQTEE